MGKTLRRLTLVLVILGFILPAAGLEPVKDSTVATIKIGSNMATVDGKSVKLRTTVDVKDGKAFIYSADLGNIMGIRFPWSPGNKMATGYDPLTNTTVVFHSDSNKVVIDGDDFTSTAKPYIKKTKADSFFMVPLRYTCDIFGWSISADKNNIVIKKPLVLPKGSWIIPGGDQSRTFCTTNGQAPKGQKLVEDWGFKKGNEETSNLYFDGKVLSNDITGWTCFDATTKKQLWKKDCDENDWNKCPIYPGSQLAYCDGKVIYNVGPTAFDATTGAVSWQLDETGGRFCAAFDGKVLACKYYRYYEKSGYEAFDVDLNCYNVSDGKKLWSTRLYEKTDANKINIDFLKLVAGNGRFILDFKVYNTSTGQLLYEIPKEEDDSLDGGRYRTAYIKTSDAFAIYNDLFIKLYNTTSGKLINKRTISIYNNIAVKNNSLYIIDIKEFKLCCLDASKLDLIWASPINPEDLGAIAMSGYQIIMENTQFISGYGLGTGKQLWKQDISKIITGYGEYGLAIVDRFVYVTTWVAHQKFTYRLVIAP